MAYFPKFLSLLAIVKLYSVWLYGHTTKLCTMHLIKGSAVYLWSHLGHQQVNPTHFPCSLCRESTTDEESRSLDAQKSPREAINHESISKHLGFLFSFCFCFVLRLLLLKSLIHAKPHVGHYVHTQDGLYLLVSSSFGSPDVLLLLGQEEVLQVFAV